MSCHVIEGTDEKCEACEAFARGEKTFSHRGEPSSPLCRRHFNAALDKAHPPGW